LSQQWKDLYLEEQDKKAKLERELEDARYKVELEMESAMREQDAMRIREGTLLFPFYFTVKCSANRDSMY